MCWSKFSQQPHDWTPNCLEFLQYLNVNVNIRVLNNFELDKYVERCQKSMNKQEMEVLKQIFYQYRDQRVNLLSTINYLEPSCAREESMMEKITRFQKFIDLFIFLFYNLVFSLVFMNNYQLEQTFNEIIKEKSYVETTSVNKYENHRDGLVGNINKQKL